MSPWCSLEELCRHGYLDVLELCFQSVAAVLLRQFWRSICVNCSYVLQRGSDVQRCTFLGCVRLVISLMAGASCGDVAVRAWKCVIPA